MTRNGDFAGREEMENVLLKKKLKKTRQLAVVLGLFVVALVLTLFVIVAIHLLRYDNGSGSTPMACGTVPDDASVKDILDEPSNPGPFHELTVAEMKKVRQFLESEIGLVKPEIARLRDPHIFTMDLELPRKADVLAHLDHDAPAPSRQARVIVFRGDLLPPVVEERVCGPLAGPMSCRVDLTVPFSQRPIESREYVFYDKALFKRIQSTFGHVLRESYNGSYDRDTCEDDCLNYYNYPVGNQRYSASGERQMWILVLNDYPYQTMHPLDFGVLCSVDGVDEDKFDILKVWYAGVLYNDIKDFLSLYNNGTIKKTRLTYPTKEEAMFSTLKQRGPPKPAYSRRPPELIEPDGKRYTVRHRKIEYLDMWSFNFRMSTIFGPGIYDVRFLGERIAYEINLAELVVFYSGFNPLQRQAFYVDSFVLTGSQSQALVAGADCPTTATFLPLTVASQGNEEPAVFPRAICVFEQNLGTPIRRHHNYDKDSGLDYGSMLDSALVVRSIHTIDNYDYIIDFTFHQNGALGVSIGQSGYLLASYYTPEERPYGVKLNDRMTGAIHIHLANFKVDLDVNGTSNRFETLDIKEETVTLREADPSKAQYSQTRFDHNLKRTERQAAYKHDFDKPMYHIFHNDNARNRYGEKKAYRLVSNSMVKQLLRENVGNEGTQAWARYQLAVTRQKDEEKTSGNPYSQWVADSKVVDFETFIADDEDIVDKDLVAWVTLGFHHIPHSEDLPVTTTSGKHQSFYLYPYNYFPECPSMMSRDAVYVSQKDPEDPSKGIKFDYHGTGDVSSYKNGGTCTYKPIDTSAFWIRNPDDLLEVTKHNGVI